MTIMDKIFVEIIKVGEILDECLKNGSIINLEALQDTNKTLWSGKISKNKKKKKVVTVMVV